METLFTETGLTEAGLTEAVGPPWNLGALTLQFSAWIETTTPRQIFHPLHPLFVP